jgi:uncharacterized protein (TIGR01777 family)
MKALMTGATGLIGGHLLTRLTQPRILARDPVRARERLGVDDVVPWTPEGVVPSTAVDDVDVVFHLAGEPVAGGRFTDARKRAIRDSRVLGTRSLVNALRLARTKPAVLVCASAIGIYGTRGDERLTEESPRGSGFLADVCREWEEEALSARALGIRVVCVRIGIVLAREGGALAPMLLPFRFGVGGPMGSGQQWMSWIHLDDVVELLLHSARNPAVEGAMNVCAPTPVRNAEFSSALGRAMHRPSWLRAPATALRIVLGEMADVVLGSQRVIPAKAEATGYTFRFTNLDGALQNLLGARGASSEPQEVHS